MKIITLKEGNYVVNPEKEFTRFEETTTLPGLKMAIQPFLIITQNDYILLDLGLGFNEDGIPLIHKILERNAIQPEQITKVLISHLHKDHIDGIGYFDGPAFIGNFPNAEIYIQERELDFALTQEKSPSYNLAVLNQLKHLSNIVFMNDDEGQITDEIFYEVSGGHTPYHQIFRIKNADETIFYGADDLPQRSYLKLHVAYKTDFNGKKAMESRKKWEVMAKEEKWKILLYHDMKYPVLEL